MPEKKGLDVRAWGRITWLLTALMLFGVGIGLVWWPASRTVADLRAQAKSAYDEANQNESDVRHAGQLHAVAAEISRDVGRLAPQDSRSAVMASTLRLLYATSRKLRIEVGAIVPRPVPTTAPLKQADYADVEALTGTDLEIDLRGSFRNLLAFADDLPRHDVLIEVRDLNISQADVSNRSRPVLSAKLDATVFQCRCIARMEALHDTAAL